MLKSKKFRWVGIFYAVIVLAVGGWYLYKTSPNHHSLGSKSASSAISTLETLPIKGRAAKTGYSRSYFSDGWANTPFCDMRNTILARDLVNISFVSGTCKLQSGILHDPYTGNVVSFVRGIDTSADVQIDHVVALGDAWQKGAQGLSVVERYSFANDPLNLLAVDGQANQNKGDSDAASWLPPNKSFRCSYVARQIAVKNKYRLWVTLAEHQAMSHVLESCPDQEIPSSDVQPVLPLAAPMTPLTPDQI